MIFTIHSSFLDPKMPPFAQNSFNVILEAKTLVFGPLKLPKTLKLG